MKNILLAVVGLSPQVLTETLFALHQQRLNVNEIHVITTRQGKEQINAHLLAPKGGKHFQYLNDYKLEPTSIKFNHDSIHVIKDENDSEIDDISTEEHNEQLLKKCLELTFKFTRSENNAVFFSVAGGRKTMASCLTLAAQLYGRPQDRIYHVLVTPEFERSREFYFPPKKSVPIALIDAKGQPYIKETRYAQVTLIPVPFISIREKISADLLNQPLDPASLMLSLVKEEEYRLTVDSTECKLRYKNIEIDFMPARMALYVLFALQKVNCSLPKGNCGGCIECFLSMSDIYDSQKELSNIYKKLSRTRELTEMSDSGILGLTAENFQSYKGKIRKDLEKGFGLYALPELEITPMGTRPNTRYGFTIEKKRLRVVM